MLTAREAFKAGFLLRCADEALDAAGVRARLVKAAALVERLPTTDRAVELAKEAGLIKQADTVLGTAGNLLSVATLLGLAAPLAGGAGLGYAAAKMTESQVDADDVKRQEMIHEYRRLANAARQHAKMKMLRTGGR